MPHTPSERLRKQTDVEESDMDDDEIVAGFVGTEFVAHNDSEFHQQQQQQPLLHNCSTTIDRQDDCVTSIPSSDTAQLVPNTLETRDIKKSTFHPSRGSPSDTTMDMGLGQPMRPVRPKSYSASKSCARTTPDSIRSYAIPRAPNSARQYHPPLSKAPVDLFASTSLTNTIDRPLCPATASVPNVLVDTNFTDNTLFPDACQPVSLTWAPSESVSRRPASDRTCQSNEVEGEEASAYLERTVFPTLLKAIESILHSVKIGKEVTDPIGSIALFIAKQNPMQTSCTPNRPKRSKFLEMRVERMDELPLGHACPPLCLASGLHHPAGFSSSLLSLQSDGLASSMCLADSGSIGRDDSLSQATILL
ncbi:hypothetical protein BASA50_002093 [Batrachochytrium salamandrivorans]|uniref:Uncharacterized protein n=1 Tax=Batrachochytrium salamandrivorans TaxID=1357716 RepID=A0ABQ8FMH7_9FUNG|nr:hypothetical protein BASA50_002093 [Batrachochytrium salamandrivorans]